jgi:hypothetical protein
MKNSIPVLFTGLGKSWMGWLLIYLGRDEADSSQVYAERDTQDRFQVGRERDG